MKDYTPGPGITKKSVIDYALANDKFYEKYNEMTIDEEQEKFDLSDHNLLEIYVTAGPVRKRYNRNKWITREYYKTDKASPMIYEQYVQNSKTREEVKKKYEWPREQDCQSSQWVSKGNI